MLEYFREYLMYFCTPIFREMKINELLKVKGERQA